MTSHPLTDAELLAQPLTAYMNETQQQFFRALLLRPTASLCIETPVHRSQTTPGTTRKTPARP